MDPTQTETTQYAASNIVQPDADRQIPETEFEGKLTPQGESSAMSSVREDAEGAIHYLLFTSTKPAVLIARAWHVRGLPFAFEHYALYQELAARSSCHVVSVTTPEAGGIDHFVFLAKTHGLTDQECLDCIEKVAPAEINDEPWPSRI